MILSNMKLLQSALASPRKVHTAAYLNLSWFFANTGSASGKMDRTGQRPIWILRFLLLLVSRVYGKKGGKWWYLPIRLTAGPGNLPAS
jgi:hypothetical protein